MEDFSSEYVPPAPAKRRVKIVDHRQSPSSDQQSGRESNNSYVPPPPPPVKSKPKSELHASPVKSKTSQEPHSAHSNGSRSTNGKAHEHLYAQATHDPGQPFVLSLLLLLFVFFSFRELRQFVQESAASFTIDEERQNRPERLQKLRSERWLWSSVRWQ